LLFQVLALLFGIVFLLLSAGIAYQQHGLRKDRRKHRPPGRLVELGSRRLHICETGSGEPVVIFESGLASSSLSWNPVQEIVGKATRAISYDRAGIGWSDETSEARTVASMTSDLRALLSASGNLPPYVLVGHSFGALLARGYAGFRTEEVVGLVLVDPVSVGYWADCTEGEKKRLRLGSRLARRGSLLANLGVVRLALNALSSGRTRLPKAIANVSAAKAMGTMSRLTGVVQKLPASLRPAVQSHWSQAKSFRSLAEYIEILQQSSEEAQRINLPVGLPLTILSAANATAQELSERDSWVRASSRGRHLQIPDSGHWIQLEHPEQVAAAVLELVQYIRES
jgi:pimeloyl-ACP methyl ester carboxylesterase